MTISSVKPFARLAPALAAESLGPAKVRPCAIADTAEVSSVDNWLRRIDAGTVVHMRELGFSGSGAASLAALRASFPDLTLRLNATFANADCHVLQLSLSGTFARDLGFITATGKRVEDVPVFAIAKLRQDGRIAELSLQSAPSIILRELGGIPDLRGKIGRLRLIARKSVGTALSVAAKAAYGAVRAFFTPKPVTPETQYVPAETVKTPIDAVLRHLAAENAGDVKATLETMSPHLIKTLPSDAATYGTRAAMYGHYREALGALKGTFAPTLVAEGDSGTVYVAYHFSGIHAGPLGGIPATGKPVEYDGELIFKVDADLSVASETSYADPLPLLASLRLTDDPRTAEGLRRLIGR
jgi:predicted ester cyclase